LANFNTNRNAILSNTEIVAERYYHTIYSFMT